MPVPSISVVIPTYGRSVSTRAAIKSALSQEAVDLEIVVVDDCSEPPLDLEEEFAVDPRVRLVRRKRNGGAAAARMTGVAAARFDVIAFLDSDDTFLPGKLSAQVRLVDPARPLDVIVSGFRYLQANPRRSRDRFPVEASNILQFASGCWFCPGSTAVVQKKAFDIVGPFNERLRRLEDLEWFMRLSLAGGRVVSADIVGSAIHVGSNADPVVVKAAAELIVEAFTSNRDNPSLDRHVAKRLMAYLALEQAAAHRKAGDPLGAFVYALRSLLLVPRRTIHLNKWWRFGPTQRL